MKDTDYVYAVGRIRVNELSLLSSSDMRRLVSAKTYKEAVSILSSKGYNITADDYSAAIVEQKEKTWQLINEVLPDISQMNSLIIRNDYHNLKTAIKAAVTGIDARAYLITPCVYDKDFIYNTVAEHKFSALPGDMGRRAERAYDILARTMSAQLSDASTDKGAMKAMLSFAEKADSDIFTELAECTVACTDIKILYRCIQTGKEKTFMKYAACSCKAFSSDDIIAKAICGMDDFLAYLDRTDYADAANALRESTTAFEKYCDDRLMKIVEKGKTTAFGIAPVAAYYVAKEAELMSVRIILSGKLNGISEEVIGERVRELYV